MDEKQSRENELAIADIKGELKLIHSHIDTIKNNDLAHIQQSVNSINKVLWTIGVMVLGHFLYALRSILLG
jgi:hypothetical protein|tara:strand:- start:998 stop:1210 length:213 start_codon:yes stop_codon:yes gene_type:complete